MFRRIINISTAILLTLGLYAQREKEAGYFKILYDSLWNHYDEGSFNEVLRISDSLIKYQNLAEDRSRIGKVYNIAGIIYRNKGELTKSLNCYQSALPYTNDDYLMASILTNIANANADQGDITKAIANNFRALKILDTLYQALQVKIYHNIGYAYLRVERWKKAIEYTEKSIHLSSVIHGSDQGDSYYNCAMAYMHIGEFEKSEHYYNISKEIYLREFGPDHHKTAMVYINYAELLTKIKSYRKALKFLTQSYDILKNTVGKNHIYTFYCLRDIGKYYLATEEYQEALRYFNKANKNPNNSGLDIIDLLNNKALALEGIYEITSEEETLVNSLSEIDSATMRIEKLRRGYLSEESKLRLAKNENGVYKTGIRISEKLYQFTRDHKYIESAFNFSEKEKYAILHDLIADVSQKRVYSYQIQEILKPNQALVEYSLHDTRLYIFVLTDDTIAIETGKIDSKFFKSLSKYQEILHRDHSSSYREYKESASYLYKELLKPVEQILRGTRELIIVPDSKLSRISFDALLTDEYKVNPMNMYRTIEPYLIKKYALIYSHSARMLVGLENKRFPVWRSFIGYAPDYTNSPDSLRNVPESFPVTRKFARMFLGKSLIREEATAERFRKGDQFNVINVFAHGLEDTTVAGQSKMIFYSKDSVNRGYIYSREIPEIPISANLVSLISCYSGSGQLIEGEGIMSISRSFSIAGVPSLIISLWGARSTPSIKILKEFYRQLRKGKSKPRAMQIAKLKYIENTSTIGANPRLWSGIIIYGNPEAIFSHFLLKIYFIPAVILILLIGIVLRKRLSKLF